MIVSLNPFFPHDYPPTLLPHVIETHRDRLPEGTSFAYFRIRAYHHFCLEPSAVVAGDRDAVRRILETCTAVLFDLSHEGPGFSGDVARQLARFAHMYGVAPRRIIFVSTNEQFLADFRAHAATPKVSAGVRWVWFHHYLYQLANIAQRRHWAKLGHGYVDAPAARTVPFLSLNATPRGHRALLAYLIATHPRREAFVCSFTLGGPKAHPENVVRVFRAFGREFGLVWDDVAPVIADDSRFDRTALADLAPPELVRTLEPELYERTRVSLVTETEMTRGEIRRTTEKVFKPVLLGQPAVVFGNPGTLGLMRSLGIDTFDDALDNGYDAVVDPPKRFAAAWALAGDLLADGAGLVERPAVRDRLHANVALFEGEMLRRAADRTMTELAAAIA